MLFDLDPDPPEPPPAEPWVAAARAQPGGAARRRAGRARRRRRSASRAPRRAPSAGRRTPSAPGSTALGGLAAITQAGIAGAPRSPLNVRIGPHRRFAWVDGDLATFKAIKNALGGTVNDVVLTVVAGALRSHFLAHGYDTART